MVGGEDGEEVESACEVGGVVIERRGERGGDGFESGEVD